MAGPLETLKYLAGVAPLPQVGVNKGMASYPSTIQEDPDLLAYGTGNEAYISGERARVLGNPMDDNRPFAANGMGFEVMLDPDHNVPQAGSPNTAALYAAAQQAIRRSPLAALGYDPTKFALDVEAQKGAPTHYAGAYIGPGYSSENGERREIDSGYVNANYPSTLVHESTHRGINQLRESGLLPNWVKFLPDEELIVRVLMADRVGDPEVGRGAAGERLRAEALNAFDEGSVLGRFRRAGLAAMEEAATKELARRKPGGPR